MWSTDIPLWLVRAYALAWGAIWGSFANVVIYRWPEGQSVVRPPSRCPRCGHRVRARDNIPVLSWVILRGRCRDCRSPIAPRYALVEALYALAALGISASVFTPDGPVPLQTALAVFLSRFAFAWGLLTAAFIDLDTMLIPDEISLGGTVAALAIARILPGVGLRAGLSGAALGFAIPFSLYFVWSRFLHREGMGLGDAKLLAFIGAYLCPPGVLFALSVGALQGLVAAGVSRATGIALGPAQPRDVSRSPQEFLRLQIPFGPFLSLGALEYLFGGGTWFIRTIQDLSAGR